MDLTDSTSAIDDSHSAIHFHSIRPSGPRSGGLPITQENLVYNGPRSGHWSVKSTVFGSGIDDACPTVHHFTASKDDDGGLAQPLAGSIIGKLATASDDRKKAAVEDGIQSVAKADNEKHSAAQGQTLEKATLPKGVFIPKTDTRGIRITGKDGKTEVVRPPLMVTTPSKAETKRTTQGELPNGAQQRAPPPSASVIPPDAQTVVSHASQPSKRGVRIKGKNGEEVFMHLPTIPQGLPPASRAASAPKESKREEDNPRSPNDDQAENAQRYASAAEIAKQLREERDVQTRIQEEAQEQRARDAKRAAEALMMSGALPATKSSKGTSAKKMTAVQSVKSSGKESGVAFGGLFDETNNDKISRPPSLGSSKTSVPRCSQKGGHAKSSGQSSQRRPSVKSTGKGSEETQSVRSKPRSKSGWEGSGSERNLDKAARRQRSLRSGYQRSWQANSETPPPSVDFRNDNTNAPSESTNRSQPFPREPGGGEEPTIFAGHGWISPHPLSRAPSQFERSPDPVIEIPSSRNGKGSQEGVKKTMTYDEWKALRRSSDSHTVSVRLDTGRQERRNFSRSSSGAQGYEGGSWGFRGLPRRADDDDKGVGDGGGGSWGGYRSATVESVRGSRSGRTEGGGTYEHEFDGESVRQWKEDGDGKTRLRMPWDGGADW